MPRNGADSTPGDVAIVPNRNRTLQTIGEIVEYLRQVIEGVNFMHKHGFAHQYVIFVWGNILALTRRSDINNNNIMMDSRPLYTAPVHPWKTWMRRDWTGPARPPSTRTENPVKYYFIDFGISSSYASFKQRERIWGTACQDGTVPEFQVVDLYDPFKVDLYTLGNVFKQIFLEVCVCDRELNKATTDFD